MSSQGAALTKPRKNPEKNNISRISRAILMILSCVIYLTYSLRDKNIHEVISGQGHVMRLCQGQM